MRRVVRLLVFVGCCEMGAYGWLFLLDRYRDISFHPVDTLSAEHVKELRRMVSGDSVYLEPHARLGWTIRPNGKHGSYRANAQGIRGDREYALTAPGNVVRIASFGDSFTHANDVANHETWEVALERTGSRLEVINFGVPAYGVDQSLLRYLEQGAAYQPDIVLIGFLPESIYRQVNDFRPFYRNDTGLPLAKPRYRLQQGDLFLISNPLPTLDHYRRLLDKPELVLPELGAQDYFYPLRYKSGVLDISAVVRLVKMAVENIVRFTKDPYSVLGTSYDSESEAFLVTAALFDRFYETVEERGASPVIIIFPLWDDIQRYRSGQMTGYAPLLRYFDSKGYRYIDLALAFPESSGYGIQDLFVGHYSALGNQLIGRHVCDYLRNQKLLTLESGRPDCRLAEEAISGR